MPLPSVFIPTLNMARDSNMVVPDINIWRMEQCYVICYIHVFITSALCGDYVIVGVCPSVCLLVCEEWNSKTSRWIFFKFSHIVHIMLSNRWLNFVDVNVTIAYFKITLKFMGPLAWRGFVLCECKSRL